MIFGDTYALHLPLFFLDIPFRKGIPLFATARFFVFVGALEVGFKYILLICRKISGWEQF